MNLFLKHRKYAVGIIQVAGYVRDFKNIAISRPEVGQEVGEEGE